MVLDDPAEAPRIRERKHEPDGTRLSRREQIPLGKIGAQLSLEVREITLDLDCDHFDRGREHEVDRPGVRGIRSDSDLELRMP